MPGGEDVPAARAHLVWLFRQETVEGLVVHMSRNSNHVGINPSMAMLQVPGQLVEGVLTSGDWTPTPVPTTCPGWP